jgi:hypothetical protein
MYHATYKCSADCSKPLSTRTREQLKLANGQSWPGEAVCDGCGAKAVKLTPRQLRAELDLVRKTAGRFLLYTHRSDVPVPVDLDRELATPGVRIARIDSAEVHSTIYRIGDRYYRRVAYESASVAWDFMSNCKEVHVINEQEARHLRWQAELPTSQTQQS